MQWIQYSSVVVKNDRVYSLHTTPARTRPVHMRSTHNMSWVNDTYWESRLPCRPSRNDGCLQVVRDISHGYTRSQVGRMVRSKIVSFKKSGCLLWQHCKVFENNYCNYVLVKCFSNFCNFCYHQIKSFSWLKFYNFLASFHNFNK